jgi:hypothetical protein
MKKILGLTITAAALLSFANSFADDAHPNTLESKAKHFEKLAIESGKLTPSDQKCWGDIKQSLGIK